MSNTKKSLIYILICYLSWGLFPIYFKLLTSIPAYELLSHRIIWSFIFMVFVVALAKNRKETLLEIKNLWANKKAFSLLIIASILITLNWLIYIIAVNNNKILEASFGYYLNPIVTIILAVIFLKERLSRVQKLACLCVACSLLYLFISLGTLPIISLCLALTFGLYSLCKKKIYLSPKASLLVETAVVSPIAFFYIGYISKEGTLVFPHSNTLTIVLILLAGVITAVPLMLFASGAAHIPLYLLGILQYLPPTMQFLLSIFVYNEQLSTPKLISFSIIWLAVIIFCYSTIMTMKKSKVN